MRYCGSKARLAKYIVPFLTSAIKDEETVFFDMCCGGCSIVSEVPHWNKIAVDSNEYLISLWRKLKDNVTNGFPYDGIPYDITEEQYDSIKKSYLNRDGRWPDYIIGYVGNALSYGSSWFNGFAKPNYNKRNSRGEPENHCHEAYNGLMKQLRNFKNIDTTEFICASFEKIHPSENSVVYTDPPYFSTKEYKDSFPHERFYQWCRDLANNGTKVFISEYQMPDDFKCIWEKDVPDGMGTTYKGDKQKRKTEKLFTL